VTNDRGSTRPSRTEKEREPGSRRSPGGARRPISVAAAAGWTIGAILVVPIFLGLAEEARPGAQADLVTFTGCYVVTYLLILFAMLRVYEPETSIREVVGLRSVSPVAPVLAAIAGAGCYPTLSLLEGLVARRLEAPSEDEQEIVAKLFSAHGVGSRGFLFVAMALLVPLTQEAFFRGALYGGLKRGRGRVEALLAAAACSVFPDLRTLATTLVIGLLLAWLRAESGSVAPSFAANAAFSAVPIVRYFQTSTFEDRYPRPWTIGGAAAAIVALAALFAIFRKDPRAVAGRAADG